MSGASFEAALVCVLVVLAVEVVAVVEVAAVPRPRWHFAVPPGRAMQPRLRPSGSLPT